MGQECLGRDAVVEAAGTGGNVWTLSVLPKFGKKILLRFFSAGGNGGTCLHPAKMSAKSFHCAALGNLEERQDIPAKSTYVELYHLTMSAYSS